MWGAKPDKGQFEDAPPGSTASGPITGVPSGTKPGASIDNQFTSWEKLGCNMKPMGRGRIMEERKKLMSPELDDELIKRELNDSALKLDESWLKGQEELDESRRKWKELLSTPQTSSSNTYDDYAALVDPYGPRAAPAFVMKNEDFPPL